MLAGVCRCLAACVQRLPSCFILYVEGSEKRIIQWAVRCREVGSGVPEPWREVTRSITTHTSYILLFPQCLLMDRAEDSVDSCLTPLAIM